MEQLETVLPVLSVLDTESDKFMNCCLRGVILLWWSPFITLLRVTQIWI